LPQRRLSARDFVYDEAGERLSSATAINGWRQRSNLPRDSTISKAARDTGLCSRPAVTCGTRAVLILPTDSYVSPRTGRLASDERIYRRTLEPIGGGAANLTRTIFGSVAFYSGALARGRARAGGGVHHASVDAIWECITTHLCSRAGAIRRGRTCYAIRGSVRCARRAVRASSTCRIATSTRCGAAHGSAARLSAGRATVRGGCIRGSAAGARAGRSAATFWV
jgi:hypothetical protein